MRTGAATPEELETLLEDAFVIHDRDVVRQLFEDGGVLVVGDGWKQARGGEAIRRMVTEMWDRDQTYVADPRRVVQAGELALVVADRGVSVVRRGSDRVWRYAISVLSLEQGVPGQQR